MVRRPPQFAASRSGFTLIELLVVIAIVALLVGILLPALHRARNAGEQAREMSAARQVMLAYHAYANDHRGDVLPGVLADQDLVGPSPSFSVLNEQGDVLAPLAAKRYPWRLASYLEGGIRSLILDDEVEVAIDDAYGKGGASPSQFLVDYNLSIFSTLGLNADYVGGAYSRGDDGLSYSRPETWFRERSRFGVVTRLDQPRRMDRLLTLASARIPRQWYDPQLGLAEPEGYHRVTPPTLDDDRVWATTYDARADDTRANSGNVDLRHDERAVSAILDGHAELLGWDDLDDMTRWTDRAKTPALTR
ncbi:MAG: type II secretion system protein [Planctomycetota bacterium]